MSVAQLIIKSDSDADWALYGDGLSVVGVIRFYETSRTFRFGDGVTNWEDLAVLDFLWEKVLTTLYPMTDNDNVNIGTGGFSGRSLTLDLTNVTAPAEGQINWNSDDGTAQIGMPGGVVKLQLGQEMFLPKGKAIGSAINNGQVVYISGASGSKPELTLAKADAHATAAGTIAVATEDVIENANGFYTSSGTVHNVDTSGYTAGDLIYLSEITAGAFTNVKPVQPNHVVCVGFVFYAHATEGIIFVNIDVKTIPAVDLEYGFATVNAATYAILNSDFILNVTYTATGSVIITLPTAQATAGRQINIKDAGFNALANNISVVTEGAELIENDTDLLIDGDGDSWTLYSDGTNWFIQ